MMFCEDEDGLGFAGCENETGAVDVAADMVVIRWWVLCEMRWCEVRWTLPD